MATKAELSVDLDVPAAEAFDATCRALLASGFALANLDPTSGIISASSDIGLASWGEKLDLYVQPTTATASTVVLRSALKFGLVDWGKNKRNVEKLAEAIRQQAALGPGPGPMPGAAIPGAPAPAMPPGWYPDPSGRHHHRWWDGHRWTAAASTHGTPTNDPLPDPPA